MELQPIATICRFLGKSPNNSEDLILSELPVARIPGDKKSTPKVIPESFFKWLSRRMSGAASVEDIKKDFIDFLEREEKAKAEKAAKRKSQKRGVAA